MPFCLSAKYVRSAAMASAALFDCQNGFQHRSCWCLSSANSTRSINHDSPTLLDNKVRFECLRRSTKISRSSGFGNAVSCICVDVCESLTCSRRLPALSLLGGRSAVTTPTLVPAVIEHLHLIRCAFSLLAFVACLMRLRSFHLLRLPTDLDPPQSIYVAFTHFAAIIVPRLTYGSERECDFVQPFGPREVTVFIATAGDPFSHQRIRIIPVEGIISSRFGVL